MTIRGEMKLQDLTDELDERRQKAESDTKHKAAELAASKTINNVMATSTTP